MVTTGGRDFELLRGIVDRLLGDIGGLVFLLAHGLEAELAGDQLDLIEVESLVDRDHQPEVLEREADDLAWPAILRICASSLTVMNSLTRTVFCSRSASACARRFASLRANAVSAGERRRVRTRRASAPSSCDDVRVTAS